jgi:hypothetical protein
MRPASVLHRLVWAGVILVCTVLPLADTPVWRWVPFGDSYCGNGSTTGIGVSRGESTRLLIYLQAGGACWSIATCYGARQPAAFTLGYTAENFTVSSRSMNLLAEPGGFFDRGAAHNPFRDDSYVFVPYCTGDLHGGNNVVAYDAAHTAWHRGYTNMSAYLRWLVRAFPAVTRVTLAGSSAGGYGALINWAQTQRAFGGVRVDMIDDSGTPIPNRLLPEGSALWSQLVARWNLAATLPADCTDCLNQGFSALIPYYAAAQPGDKGAYLTYQTDPAVAAYYGLTAAGFKDALGRDRSLMSASATQRLFVADHSGHILFFAPAVRAGGITLQTWLTAMTTDSAAWQNLD